MEYVPLLFRFACGLVMFFSVPVAGWFLSRWLVDKYIKEDKKPSVLMAINIFFGLVAMLIVGVICFFVLVMVLPLFGIYGLPIPR